MVKIFRCFRVQHLTFLQIVANFDFETLHIMIFKQKDRKDVEGCLAETSFHQVHWGGIEYPPWELAQRALRRIEVPSFAFGATSGVGAGGSRVLVSFVRLPLEKMSPLMRGHGKSRSRGVSSISMFFFSTKCFLVFWRGMIIIHIHTNMPVVWMICIIIMYPYHSYIHYTGKSAYIWYISQQYPAKLGDQSFRENIWGPHESSTVVVGKQVLTEFL